MASFVTVIVLTVLIDVLVAGFSRRCLTAILGSVAGTVVTCLSAWGLTILLKLDGGDLPYVVPLLSQSAMRVDTRSLYIGMMFLANSGALMDLSMDISVSMEEVHHHKPDISRRALMKSGLLVGRSVLECVSKFARQHFRHLFLHFHVFKPRFTASKPSVFILELQENLLETAPVSF